MAFSHFLQVNRSELDFEAVDFFGFTPIFFAVRYQSDPIFVSFFITEEVDLETRSLGMTILLWAAINNSNPEVLQVLLNAGADKDATFLPEDDEGNGEEFEGWNALHFAASGNSNPEVLQTLLNAGFDKNAKTSTTGLTAYDIAIDKNPNPEVANVLK